MKNNVKKVFQAILDSLPSNIAVLNEDGDIQMNNRHGCVLRTRMMMIWFDVDQVLTTCRYVRKQKGVVQKVLVKLVIRLHENHRGREQQNQIIHLFH